MAVASPAALERGPAVGERLGTEVAGAIGQEVERDVRRGAVSASIATRDAAGWIRRSRASKLSPSSRR